MRATRGAQIIVVAGGKGGVGKTTIAVNLAILLARKGTSTVLIDADFCLAGIRVLIDATPVSDLGDVLAGKRPVGDLLSPAGENLWIIGGLPGGRRDGEPGWAEALERLRGACDTIIVDGGSGVTDAVLDLTLAADRLILPTTPEPTSLADSYAFLKLLSRAGFTGSIGIAATMADGDAQAAEVARRIDQVARQFLGLEVDDLGGVPHDAHVSRAISAARARRLAFPALPGQLALHALVQRIDPWQPAVRPPGVFPRIAALFL